MKKTFSHSVIIGAVLLTASSASAIGVKDMRNPRAAHDRTGVVTNVKENRSALPSFHSVPREAAEGTVTIDFVMADSENYSISLAVGINRATGNCDYYADNKSFGEAQIPAGEYDLMFWGSSEEEPYYYCIYGAEGVSLTEDGVFTVDFPKCTEFVKFESTLPDGSRGRMELENLDTGEIVEPGNIHMGLWTLYAFIGNQLIDWQSGFMERGMFDDGWEFDSEDGGNVLVNPGLERIALVQYRELVGSEGNNGVYYASIPVIPARGGIFTNSPADYAEFDNKIYMGDDSDSEKINTPALYVTTVFNGSTVGINSTSINPDYADYGLELWPAADKYWIGDDSEAARLGIGFYPSPAVIEAWGYAFGSEDDAALGIISNPVINDNGEARQLAVPNTFNSISKINMYNLYSNLDGEFVWKTNPWFSVYAADRTIEDGNAVPILVAEQCWYTQTAAEEYGLRSVLYHNYKGRNGEGRTIDFLGEKVNVKINGVDRDMSEIPTIHMMKLAPEDRYGIWDVDFSNEFKLSDGMKGSNTTTIHFDDKGEDVCAPTIQMLQTFDQEGKVTDRFEKLSEANLVIAGGDFTPYYIESRHMESFSVSECDIKVECAIHGEENWKELECKENEARFSMPGWGYYWEVALDGIETPAADTWYDLRITLTDEAGNYQRQTLSPVFRVAADTGINEIKDFDGDRIYYNLQGIAVSEPAPGEIYISRGKDGKSRKIILR